MVEGKELGLFWFDSFVFGCKLGSIFRFADKRSEFADNMGKFADRGLEFADNMGEFADKSVHRYDGV